MSDLVFRRNLLAISSKNTLLASLLDSASPDPRLLIRKTRTGKLVPVFSTGTREAAFHSLMVPEREAERLAFAQGSGGFIIALGLGAGYGIMPFLASPATTGVLAIEHDAGMMRSILEEIDLSELLLDPRFMLLLDPSPSELKEALFETYIPPLAGDIRSFPLRGRVDLDPETFASDMAAVRDTLDRISDDYSVQAFFGKLWFRNAARNLFAAERQTSPLAPIRRAVVTAAGPSLEEELPVIVREQGAGAFLIATDTSLPALLGSGLKPDAVISIDCQAISYYHFIKGLPADIPLILDLSSPNRLARLTPSPRFFSSGHPFCAYLSSRFRLFPALDTSGGNVTHAALSLAEALGAESALLAGADFSYPKGKSYARGTYIYDYFDRMSSHLCPIESHFSSFIFRNPSVFSERDADPDGKPYVRFVTKPLVAYREHLERFAAEASLEVKPLRGHGVEIKVSPGKRARPLTRGIFAAGRAAMSATDFLRAYAADLRALPLPDEPATIYLRTLSLEARDLWTTLLPSASALQRVAGPGKVEGPAALLESVRLWAIAEIEEALESASR